MTPSPPLRGAAQPSTPVAFDVPSGACDCHTHIHGPEGRFPYSPARVYTPEPGLPEEMAALHRALHVQRVVIVTPSVYGTDNSATLWGMQARGDDARGVAVIDDAISTDDLARMHRAGMRGVRLNLATAGVRDPAVARARFSATVARITPLGWHVQIYAEPPMIAAIRDLVAASAVPVVFDHFGGAQAEHGPRQPGFNELVELVGEGKAYVKISGAYRSSTRAPDYDDVAPLAAALIDANADRILWGTDWPHPSGHTPVGRAPTEVTPMLQIDDGALLNQLAVWAPDPGVRRKILVDNPARLYGF